MFMESSVNISNSYDLLAFLKSQNLLNNAKDELWWENSGSFEIIIGAILVQNTKWERVEIALKNLKSRNLASLESLANCDLLILSELIKTCGFHNQKAKRLQNLCKNIIHNFGDFENFSECVSREWLLEQKGLGNESVDSILNYALLREVMVADKYTQKLLCAFGFEFYEYEDLQSWLECGIVENYEQVVALYGYEIELYKVYARFHGKIVEFSKTHKLGQKPTNDEF